ncbi:hypothetical protein [Paenibacillus sp. ACRRY]|uniref:hypothetical protein n=1 Tax=Paenibacillus sp. ACRRY TaxID=2918208 RepID=UPI001EF70521|nr:hypothetical protein [Paenibacillus sp. ACRRY]MCG7381401.1 hypothetical protein [Paenibacillus sp. ACRRY]
MRSTLLRDSAVGPTRLGIGFGVIALLGRWLTGLNIVDSPQALMRYGLYGSLGYSLATAFSLMLFGWLGQNVRRRSPGLTSWGEWLKAKLTPAGTRLLTGLFAVLLLEAVLLQGMVAGFFFHKLFALPEMIGRATFIAFSSMLAGYIGLKKLYHLAVPQVILTLGVAIILPLFYFIRQGVDPVYSGIRLYHPYMLVIDNHAAFLFIATGIWVGLGQVISDPATWERSFHIDRSKMVPAFIMSGLIYATVLMAFLLLVMVAIHSGGLADEPSLIYPLLSVTRSPVLFGLMVTCLLTMFAVSYISRFQALLSLCMETFADAATRGKQIRNVYIGLAAVVATIMSIGISITPIQILYLFGAFQACMLGPMLLLSFSNKQVHGIALPLIAFVGWSTWSILHKLGTYSGLERIWISGIMSSALSCIYLFVAQESPSDKKASGETF